MKYNLVTTVLKYTCGFVAATALFIGGSKSIFAHSNNTEGSKGWDIDKVRVEKEANAGSTLTFKPEQLEEQHHQITDTSTHIDTQKQPMSSVMVGDAWYKRIFNLDEEVYYTENSGYNKKVCEEVEKKQVYVRMLNKIGGYWTNCSEDEIGARIKKETPKWMIL